MYNHTFAIRKNQQVVLPDVDWLVKLEDATLMEPEGGLFTEIHKWFLQYKWITIKQLQSINECFRERGL